jgi:methylmalonyl-CoA/ethylmalonyl-CoA epimerase
MTTVTTFDHIAIATHRMADAAAVLMGELGGVPAFGGDSGSYRFGQWRFENGARLEVLEPMGSGGFLHRFLAQHGPGVHHVTFRVPDLRAACARAEAAGYGIVGFDDGNPYWQEAFLHPRQAMGVVVQLAQSRPAPSGRGPRWSPPPIAASAPAAVRLLGLRLSARDAARARRQWVEVLQGELSDGLPGELLVRWPRSPLRLAVDVDPGAPEGPVCLEVAAERVLLADGRHPVLGVTIRPVKDEPHDGGPA